MESNNKRGRVVDCERRVNLIGTLFAQQRQTHVGLAIMMTDVRMPINVADAPAGYAAGEGGDRSQHFDKQDENVFVPFAELFGGMVHAQATHFAYDAAAVTGTAGNMATVGDEHGLPQGNPLPLWNGLAGVSGFAAVLEPPVNSGGDDVMPAGMFPASLRGLALSREGGLQMDDRPTAVTPQLVALRPAGDVVTMAEFAEQRFDPGENLEATMLQRLVERQVQSSELGDIAGKSAATALDSLLGGPADAKPLTKTESPLTAVAQQPSRPSVVIDTPVLDARWRAEFNQRVAWLVKEGVPQAEVRLNPPHLGPVEIKIAMNDDQASVTFMAQHQSVRDVIEAALPRLREMLNQSGMQLADASVTDQSADGRQGEAQRHWHGQESSAAGEAGVHEQIVEVRGAVVGDDGGVDYYV